MKQADGAKFSEWLRENRYSIPAFAKLMAQELEADTFSERTVEKWVQGVAMPRRRNMAAIKRLTGLTADDFMGEGA